MTTSDRMEVVVLGEVIGTASGWDKIEECYPVFYDFLPAEHINLIPGDLGVDYVQGHFLYHADNGDLVGDYSLLDTMHDFVTQRDYARP